MELPEQPASDPLPPAAPARDIHADGDVPADEEEDDDRCGNIHCACAHG